MKKTAILIVLLGPHFDSLEVVGNSVAGIDFNTILMKIMLGFLLLPLCRPFLISLLIQILVLLLPWRRRSASRIKKA